MAAEELKRCTKCGLQKDKSEFYKNKNKPDGLDSWCKACSSKNGASWYKRKKEKAKESARKWAKNNPEKVKERQRKWAKNNPEKRAERSQRWREDNPEYYREIYRKRKQACPEIYRKNARSRRTRELESDGNHTIEEWQKLLDYYDNKCVACGILATDTYLGILTLDHIQPLSKGGSDSISNIQPLCKPCNSTKGNRHSTDYRLTIPEWINTKRDQIIYKQLNFNELIGD